MEKGFTIDLLHKLIDSANFTEYELKSMVGLSFRKTPIGPRIEMIMEKGFTITIYRSWETIDELQKHTSTEQC